MGTRALTPPTRRRKIGINGWPPKTEEDLETFRTQTLDLLGDSSLKLMDLEKTL